MSVTIKVNGTANSLVHKMSSGLSAATIPDVCKTPSPAGPVPLPYPNIAQSITLSNGAPTVKGDKGMAANKGSNFALSNGDNAGVAGGVKSSTFMKEATWILYSFDVKLNGKNACRFTDKMFHNHENAANLGGEIQLTALVVVCFQPGDKIANDPEKLKEFKRQLKRQQNAINKQTVKNFKQARSNFKSFGRGSGAAQQAARGAETAARTERLAESLMDAGMGPAQAMRSAIKQVAKVMKTLAALHEPDMIAGGVNAVKGFGSRNVNSSIGSQWKSRVKQLDKAAKAVKPPDDAETLMNVSLDVC